MNDSCIFRNPPISTTLYPFVKVLRVETQDVGYERPKIYVEMRVPGLQPELSGQYLYSVIHATEKVVYPHEKFCECFGITGQRYLDVQGRWAAIRLVPIGYKGTSFSAVQWVRQSDLSRWKAQGFEQLERQGQLPAWDAGDADETGEQSLVGASLRLTVRQ